jgi:hypothetical protein
MFLFRELCHHLSCISYFYTAARYYYNHLLYLLSLLLSLISFITSPHIFAQKTAVHLISSYTSTLLTFPSSSLLDLLTTNDLLTISQRRTGQELQPNQPSATRSPTPHVDCNVGRHHSPIRLHNPTMAFTLLACHRPYQARRLHVLP